MERYYLVIVENHEFKSCCQIYRQVWFINGKKIKYVNMRWTEKLHEASVFNSLDSVSKLKRILFVSKLAVTITENEYNVFLMMVS